MKQYISPEVEMQTFCAAEDVMLENFDLTASSVEGGFSERP